MNFRLAIDGAMILSMVFFGGVGWAKLDAHGNQVEHLTATVQALTSSGERLARMEVQLGQISRDLERLQKQSEEENAYNRSRVRP